MWHRTRASVGLLVLIGLFSCENPNEAARDTIATLEITGVHESLWVADTVSLFVEARDSSGAIVSDVSVAWSSSDTAVLSVGSNGVGHARAVGVAAVEARAGRQVARTELAVVPQSVSSVWPDTSALLPGMERVLVARHISQSIRIRVATQATWSTSDPAVASVDASGRVIAGVPGQATITATAGTSQAVAEVFVRDHAAPFEFVAFASSGGGYPRHCGVTREAALYCWGDDIHGVDDLGPTDRCERIGSAAGGGVFLLRFRCSEIPLRMLAGTPVDSTWLHFSDGCALMLDGAARCWGYFGTFTLSFQTVQAEVRLKSLAMGAGHTCATGADSLAYCWGSNSAGQFGNGTRASSAIPVQIDPDRKWKALVASWMTTCGLDIDGAAFCWGERIGATTAPGCFLPCALSPQRIVAPEAFVQLAVGPAIICGLAASGDVYCWSTYASTLTYSAASRVVSDIKLVSLSGRMLPTPCGLTATGERVCVEGLTAASTTTYSFYSTMLGVKLKAATDGCGIALDDRAYCWTAGKNPIVNLVPGQRP